MLPLQPFKDYIHEHALFGDQDQVLLAVSGGKDSVLMAHLFKLCGYRFGIAHCNFNLRAEESVRDEHFVKMLAETLEVPFFVQHFDTRAYVAEHQVSVQMAARALRYAWFEELRYAENYRMIALAQHQDDAIETVLLNLTRGTGIAGLHGILPKRGNLIRPLLFLSAAEISSLVANAGLSFVEDSSNTSTYYARNKLRLQVIPKLKEINPNLENTFMQNIRRFAETEQVLQQVAADLRESLLRHEEQAIHLSLEKIKQLNPQHLLLFEVLKPYGFEEPVIAEVLLALDKQSGTTFLSASHQLVVDREDLILTVRGNDVLPAHQRLHLNDKQVVYDGQELLVETIPAADFDPELLKHPDQDIAYINTDKLIFPLVLRSWQAGDRFRPLGMKGFKKLSDFFIDAKVALNRKAHIPVLVNGNGELIWLVGWRLDDRYKLHAATENVTIITCRALHNYIY